MSADFGMQSAEWEKLFGTHRHALFVGGEAFDLGEVFDVGGDVFERAGVVLNDTAAAEEVIRGQTRRPASGAAGREYVRRSRRVIAEGHGAVVAQECRAGVADLFQQFSSVIGGDV